MSKRVAVVTGGIGGLGTEICKTLARAGRTVVATDLAAREDRIAEFRRDVEGLDIHFEPGNVGDFEACGALVRKLEAERGSVDILVNAAGITRDTLSMRMKDEDWDAVLDTNLKAVFRASRAAIRPMMKQRYGRIVNITSVVGASGNAGQPVEPPVSCTAYGGDAKAFDGHCYLFRGEATTFDDAVERAFTALGTSRGGRP